MLKGMAYKQALRLNHQRPHLAKVLRAHQLRSLA
jgi:hypothetical protein